jgi:NADPH:quinone reductase-like Zn-dependent oxidoreductase
LKTLCIEQYGSPQRPALEQRPQPLPGPGQVLIKVLASASNPCEGQHVAGHFKSALRMG